MAIPSSEPRRHETGPGNSAVYELVLSECPAHIPGALAFATVRGGGVPLTVPPHDSPEHRASQEAQGVSGVHRRARDGTPHRADTRPSLPRDDGPSHAVMERDEERAQPPSCEPSAMELVTRHAEGS